MKDFSLKVSFHRFMDSLLIPRVQLRVCTISDMHISVCTSNLQCGRKKYEKCKKSPSS